MSSTASNPNGPARQTVTITVAMGITRAHGCHEKELAK
jgi:hypothetical protein